MKNILIIVFTILSITAYSPYSFSNFFQQQCMPEMTLEELQTMYREESEKINKTPEGKKKVQREKEFSEKSLQFSTAMGKCCLWSSYCSEAELLREEASYAKDALVYAANHLKASHPNFAALEMCVHARKYDALQVEQD